MNSQRILRGTLLLGLFLSATLSHASDDATTVLVGPTGTVGVGAGHFVDPGAQIVKLKIKAQVGEINKTELKWAAGDLIWNCPDANTRQEIHLWTGVGMTRPDHMHGVRIEGNVSVGGEGGQGGDPGEDDSQVPKFTVVVNDIDADVDSDNQNDAQNESYIPHRPPSRSTAEDELEYATVEGSPDGLPGMRVPPGAPRAMVVIEANVLKDGTFQLQLDDDDLVTVYDQSEGGAPLTPSAAGIGTGFHVAFSQAVSPVSAEVPRNYVWTFYVEADDTMTGTAVLAGVVATGDEDDPEEEDDYRGLAIDLIHVSIAPVGVATLYADICPSSDRVYVALGESLTLTAVPNPSSAEFPSMQPDWSFGSVSHWSDLDGSHFTNGESQVSFTADTFGEYEITATAATMSRSLIVNAIEIDTLEEIEPQEMVVEEAYAGQYIVAGSDLLAVYITPPYDESEPFEEGSENHYWGEVLCDTGDVLLNFARPGGYVITVVRTAGEGFAVESPFLLLVEASLPLAADGGGQKDKTCQAGRYERIELTGFDLVLISTPGVNDAFINNLQSYIGSGNYTSVATLNDVHDAINTRFTQNQNQPFSLLVACHGNAGFVRIGPFATGEWMGIQYGTTIADFNAVASGKVTSTHFFSCCTAIEVNGRSFPQEVADGTGVSAATYQNKVKATSEWLGFVNRVYRVRGVGDPVVKTPTP